MKFLYVTLFAVLAVSVAASHENVEILTSANFEEKVGDGSLYFIKFFAPWCGHCKKLAPTWAELAKSFENKDDVVIASMDCTQHRPTCEAAGIQGFPTLKVYQGGEEKAKYSGARTMDALKDYVEEQHETLMELTTA